MSADDVHPNEMNSQPPDFDDAASEALLRGTGAEADPAIAQVVADMRTAFTSKPPVVGAELSALMAGSSAVGSSAARRKFERLRSSMIAKIAAGAAAAMAATGGLAVAGALPAPVQHAFSEVGVGSDSPHHAGRPNVVNSSTVTTIDGETGTTLPGDGTGGTTVTSVTPTSDNHGTEVSGVAQDGGNGCDQGAAVSAIASNGRSNNDGSQCQTTTTVPGETSTTIDNPGHGNQNNNGKHNGNGQGNNGNGHNPTPTTNAGSSPTTAPHQHGQGNQGNNGNGDH